MKPSGPAPSTQDSKQQAPSQNMQKSNELPDDNPFPWMSKKPTTPPQPQQAPPTGYTLQVYMLKLFYRELVSQFQQNRD